MAARAAPRTLWPCRGGRARSADRGWDVATWVIYSSVFCFLIRASCFLFVFSVSYFLFPISYFLFPISYFVFYVSFRPHSFFACRRRGLRGARDHPGVAQW